MQDHAHDHGIHWLYHICHQREATGLRDFPGSPVFKTSPSNAGGVGLIPGQGAKIPHALGPKNQNIKQKQYCNKFNKDFKLVHTHTQKNTKKRKRLLA